MILNYSLICLLNSPQASGNLRRVCDPCSDKRYQLHTLSLYICLLLLVQCQKKINANYRHLVTLDVLLVCYISCCLTNSWMLEFHVVLVFKTCDVIKWQLNCSLVLLFATL